MSKRVQDFKKVTTVLPSTESLILREEYIKNFINTDSRNYDERINKRYRFSDGECYVGYLWDYLSSWELIPFDSLRNHLPKDKVLVFWDVHTKERILIDDYWKFGKEDVIELTVEELIKNMELLPEDIYIFDNSMTWSIVLTHESQGEEDWPFSRVIAKCTPRIHDSHHPRQPK